MYPTVEVATRTLTHNDGVCDLHALNDARRTTEAVTNRLVLQLSFSNDRATCSIPLPTFDDPREADQAWTNLLETLKDLLVVARSNVSYSKDRNLLYCPTGGPYAVPGLFRWTMFRADSDKPKLTLTMLGGNTLHIYDWKPTALDLEVLNRLIASNSRCSPNALVDAQFPGDSNRGLVDPNSKSRSREGRSRRGAKRDRLRLGNDRNETRPSEEKESSSSEPRGRKKFRSSSPPRGESQGELENAAVTDT